MAAAEATVGNDVLPAAVLVIALLIATALGLLWRVRNGRLRDTRAGAPALSRAELVALGGEPGERATLVQFTSAFCAPCRATSRILTDVAAMVPGVSYVEIDAEKHLDVVRRHNVLRTPTTLVLDAAGAVVVRASGQPRKADVIAAVGRAVDRSTTPLRNP